MTSRLQINKLQRRPRCNFRPPLPPEIEAPNTPPPEVRLSEPLQVLTNPCAWLPKCPFQAESPVDPPQALPPECLAGARPGCIDPGRRDRCWCMSPLRRRFAPCIEAGWFCSSVRLVWVCLPSLSPLIRGKEWRFRHAHNPELPARPSQGHP